MLRSYLPVIVFAGLGVLVGGTLAMVNGLIGPRRPNRAKSEPYECGLPSEVTRTFRFGVSFYMVAMLFILFDIEVVFLYPVGVILKAAHSVFVLVEVIVFVVLLLRRPGLRVAEGGARLEVRREKLRALAPLEEPRSPDRPSRPPASRPRPLARRPRGRRTSSSTSRSRC